MRFAKEKDAKIHVRCCWRDVSRETIPMLGIILGINAVDAVVSKQTAVERRGNATN